MSQVNLKHTSQVSILLFILIALLFSFIYFTPTFQSVVQEPGEMLPIAVSYAMLENIHLSYSTNYNIFGRSIPFGTFYHGALDSYFIAPFAMLPLNPLQISRISYFAGSLLILWFTFAFCTRFFNTFVATVATILLGLNRYFLILILHGSIYDYFLFAVFSVGGIYYLFRYHEGKKLYFLCLACLFLGLGVSVRLYFIHILCGIAFALFLSCWKLVTTQPKRAYVLGFSIFLISILPFLIICLDKGAYLNEFLKETDLFVMNTDTYGINNLHYFENLWSRCLQLRFFLDGTDDMEALRVAYGENGIAAVNTTIFIISLVFLILCLLFKKTKLPRRRILFMGYLFLGIFLVTPFTLTNLKHGHLCILMPFLQIIIAVCIYEAYHLSANKVYRCNVVVILLACILMAAKPLYLEYRIQDVDRNEEISKGYVALSNVLLDTPFETLYVGESDFPMMAIVELLTKFKITDVHPQSGIKDSTKIYKKFVLKEDSIRSSLKKWTDNDLFLVGHSLISDNSYSTVMESIVKEFDRHLVLIDSSGKKDWRLYRLASERELKKSS